MDDKKVKPPYVKMPEIKTDIDKITEQVKAWTISKGIPEFNISFERKVTTFLNGIPEPSEKIVSVTVFLSKIGHAVRCSDIDDLIKCLEIAYINQEISSIAGFEITSLLIFIIQNDTDIEVAGKEMLIMRYNDNKSIPFISYSWLLGRLKNALISCPTPDHLEYKRAEKFVFYLEYCISNGRKIAAL